LITKENLVLYHRFISRVAWLLCGLAVFTGCGGVRTDYSKLNLATVQGIVTLDDQPLAAVVVTFEAPDRTFSFATTDESGRYRLMFNSEKAGVTPGPKIVRIRANGEITEDGTSGTPEDERRPVVSEGDRVPACYNTQSKLNVTVADGSQRFDFDLKSDCSTTGPNN
jgi:hypothetical protein